jgi:iron complex outermembrane receptor protein
MVFRIGAVRVQARRPVTTVGGASAIEVNLDSLALPAAPTLAEVLRELPTVHLRTNSRGEAEISVRGSESRQVAVLVDGVPLTLSWDARTDVSVLPAAASHEINIVRGLASILHGPNVLGGVVEVSVGRGTTFPDRSAFQLTGGYDQTGGYASSVSGSMPFRSETSRLLVRAGVGFRDSPGAPLADGIVEPVANPDELRLNTDVRNVDGFLALRYARDGGSWFTLATSAFKAERGIAGELGADEPRLWRYPNVSRAIVAASMGTGDRATPLGRGDVELSLGFDAGRTEIRSYATRAYDEITGTEDGDDRTATVRLLADHTVGERADLRMALTWADISHDATVDGSLSEYQQRLMSAGAETVVRLFESDEAAVQAIRLSVGGALDRGQTPKTGGRPSLGTIDDWGARVGMTALVHGGNTLLHAGLSRRGRFPALREMYSEALNRFEPNPDLHAEHLVALEGGITTRFGDGELQLVGFRNRLSGAIRRITLPDRKRKRVNSDELRSTGVEILFSQNIGVLSLGGDLTLQSVELIDPSTTASSEPENLPERSGSAFLRFPLMAGISAVAETAYTGAQFCQDPNTGADVKLKGGSWLNARLSKVFNVPATGAGVLSHVEARAAIDNIADTALYDQCGLPRPGRLLRFEVRLF